MATTISDLDAYKLREQWGGKPCDHPKELLVEYTNNFQSKTGDYVCPICGDFFNKEERKALDEIRKSASPNE